MLLCFMFYEIGIDLGEISILTVKNYTSVKYFDYNKSMFPILLGIRK